MLFHLKGSRILTGQHCWRFPKMKAGTKTMILLLPVDGMAVHGAVPFSFPVRASSGRSRTLVTHACVRDYASVYPGGYLEQYIGLHLRKT